MLVRPQRKHASLNVLAVARLMIFAFDQEVFRSEVYHLRCTSCVIVSYHCCMLLCGAEQKPERKKRRNHAHNFVHLLVNKQGLAVWPAGQEKPIISAVAPTRLAAHSCAALRSSMNFCDIAKAFDTMPATASCNTARLVETVPIPRLHRCRRKKVENSILSIPTLLQFTCGPQHRKRSLKPLAVQRSNQSLSTTAANRHACSLIGSRDISYSVSGRPDKWGEQAPRPRSSDRHDPTAGADRDGYETALDTQTARFCTIRQLRNHAHCTVFPLPIASCCWVPGSNVLCDRTLY